MNRTCGKENLYLPQVGELGTKFGDEEFLAEKKKRILQKGGRSSSKTGLPSRKGSDLLASGKRFEAHTK